MTKQRETNLSWREFDVLVVIPLCVFPHRNCGGHHNWCLGDFLCGVISNDLFLSFILHTEVKTVTALLQFTLNSLSKSAFLLTFCSDLQPQFFVLPFLQKTLTQKCNSTLSNKSIMFSLCC